MRRRPRVALLIETAQAFGRELLRGISRYIQTHFPWSVYIKERAIEKEYRKLWTETDKLRRKWRKKKARDFGSRRVNSHLKNQDIYDKTNRRVEKLYDMLKNK